MKVLVGLGNPGAEYDGTRHNVGFRIADLVSETLGARFSRHGRYHLATGEVEGERVLIVKPMTFMNRSGEVLPGLVEQYGFGIGDILVLHDDMDLPVGRLRLRPKGSSGGHNGLKSIIGYLGTQEFPRLKVGVGSPESRDEVIDYVLSRFSRDEQSIIDQVCDASKDAALCFIREGIEASMSKYNSVWIRDGARS